MHILKELWTKYIEKYKVCNGYKCLFEFREMLDYKLKVAEQELEKA